MINLETVIINHKGSFFRFKKMGAQYVCEVCYWKGVLHPEEDGWSAEIQQKFPPFDHDQTDSNLPSAEEAMNWIADQLVKKES